ncbi:recombinase family protein [Paenibacillus farraposensis]|uniref:Recombinase family protein n=2 Tax=Paenibacillus TaxID=44249 RepID=A0ABW4D9J4_9BACL|nr:MULTISPECIES: recombinase family protein [Paenibacillus]MCC3380294.1 recombinase family protein [Paenibacillus farraposensis]MDQ0497225.1 DNA invertase Pin-like site-specific DNA recombinase [Paenibacillus brasilensis]
MIFGYARVSSFDQNLDSQIEQLRNANVDRIVQEKVSGVQNQKEELQQLLNRLVKGDTLIVTRMDRLGRNTKQLLELIEELEGRGIHLVILNLGIDTRTPSGKFILTVMSAFSELDRTMIKEKQQAGIAIAKRKGTYKGKKQKFTLRHDGVKHAIELHETTNKPIKEICKITNISEATFYRRWREYKKQKENIPTSTH